jgi:hypothetical protein
MTLYIDSVSLEVKYVVSYEQKGYIELSRTSRPHTHARGTSCRVLPVEIGKKMVLRLLYNPFSHNFKLPKQA